jgi:hypothetical protein
VTLYTVYAYHISWLDLPPSSIILPNPATPFFRQFQQASFLCSYTYTKYFDHIHRPSPLCSLAPPPLIPTSA